jgi:hypothetical protein
VRFAQAHFRYVKTRHIEKCERCSTYPTARFTSPCPSITSYGLIPTFDW